MENQQNKKGVMQRRLKTNVCHVLIKYHDYIPECEMPETAMKLHELNCLSVIADTLTELVELCKEESCDISD